MFHFENPAIFTNDIPIVMAMSMCTELDCSNIEILSYDDTEEYMLDHTPTLSNVDTKKYLAFLYLCIQFSTQLVNSYNDSSYSVNDKDKTISLKTRRVPRIKLRIRAQK